MPVNKAKAQTEGNLRVLFAVTYSGGTPSIVGVSPAIAAGDISVADTAGGRATVTIKNCKGPRGLANIQATTRTQSNHAAISGRAYSGDTLSFVVEQWNSGDDSSEVLTDSDTDIVVEAY